VQMLLHRRYRHDTAMGILQMLAGFLRGHGACLQHQYTGDDLQGIDDAVLHFRQQHFALGQKIVGVFLQKLLFLLDGAAALLPMGRIGEPVRPVRNIGPGPDMGDPRRQRIDIAIGAIGLRDLLGKSDDEIAALRSKGIV